MKIYTKTGDKGETSLFNGKRVKKTSKRIHLLGTIDELNSYIGFLISGFDSKNENINLLQKIQSNLFDLGSEIANPNIEIKNFKDFDLITTQVENNIDEIDKKLPPLQNFILPGGTDLASRSHICRTLTRKAERAFFTTKKNLVLNESAGRLLNRLSDYFFVLARYLNYCQKHEDILWKKET